MGGGGYFLFAEIGPEIVDSAMILDDTRAIEGKYIEGAISG